MIVFLILANPKDHTEITKYCQENDLKIIPMDIGKESNYQKSEIINRIIKEYRLSSEWEKFKHKLEIEKVI